MEAHTNTALQYLFQQGFEFLDAISVLTICRNRNAPSGLLCEPSLGAIFILRKGKGVGGWYS